MKKIQIISIVLFLVLGLTSWAVAGFSDPYTPLGSVPAQFYAIDNFGTSGDGSVTLSNYTSVSGYTAQYRFGGVGWTDINGVTFVVATPLFSQLVKFRLHSGSEDITSATLTFSGQDPGGSGSPFFHSVLLDFGPGNFTLNTAAGTDHVSPVPIPPTVWLLGAGLVGIGLLRKRIRR